MATIINTTMEVSTLTLTPPSTPGTKNIYGVEIHPEDLPEDLPEQLCERKEVEERSMERMMITPPTTPPPPTLECEDFSSVEIEETSVEKLEKIKSLPIPALADSVSALRKTLDTLPSLFTSDPSSSSFSSSSSLSDPQEIANHHSIIAASFSSFAFALGHALSTLEICDIALEELTGFSSTTVTPILTTHLETKSKLLRNIEKLDADLTDAKTQEATILAGLKASAHAVEESHERLEKVRCRINELAERLAVVADRRKEVEERKNRMSNRSGSSDTVKLPSLVPINFLSMFISPVALAAGAFSLNTRATDAELERLTDRSAFLKSQTSSLNPALLEKTLQDLLHGHAEQHEKLMAMQAHVFDLENTHAEIEGKIADVETQIKDVNDIVEQVGEAMNQVAALREQTMKIIALARSAKVGVLNLLVCGCPSLSATTAGNFSTVRAVVRRIVVGWVDTFGPSSGEEEGLQELITLCQQDDEQEEEVQDPNNDNGNDEQKDESTEEIVTDSDSE